VNDSGDPPIRVRKLGVQPYAESFAAMKAYTVARNAGSHDELWLVQHPPVYTLGQAGRRAHLLRDNGIEIVQTDRGGQVTYHGPGQIVLYALIDLARRGLSVRKMVEHLESAAIALLADYGIDGRRKAGATGVYVEGAKIAALGLRVRRGRCYHGLAFNADMDLAPFADIDPCGYPGLAVTQLKALAPHADFNDAQERLVRRLLERLSVEAIGA